ncbi:hypothetical protein [Amycolatopsis sp. La24]|uniref:hypothetical protein n=1 Tax=Amycolatopsis sp. La24 TaxID=3028304 RepID=UPI0023AFE541|nr:hypothetical protein [Amycolatopsis sp. La24]
MLEAAEREGDPGVLAWLRGHRDEVAALDVQEFSALLRRRATLTREWQFFSKNIRCW